MGDVKVYASEIMVMTDDDEMDFEISLELESLRRMWELRARRRRMAARLDPKGTEKPRTRLISHVRAGDCVGPSNAHPFAIEDTRTGERTRLG